MYQPEQPVIEPSIAPKQKSKIGSFFLEIFQTLIMAFDFLLSD